MSAIYLWVQIFFFFRRPDCFLEVRREQYGCGQGWWRKQSAEPHALPCKVGEDSCPPHKQQTLTAAHQSAPAQSWSQGCLLHPSVAWGSAVSMGPSGALWWELRCWVRARARSAPGPDGTWFGLGSLTRSTGPALVVMHRGSQVATTLPQQPPLVGSVVGSTCEEMVLYICFLTRRRW